MDNLLLRKLKGLTRNLRIGIFGAGRFSTGMICQIRRMPGIEVAIISDVNIQYANKVLQDAGYTTDQIFKASNSIMAQQGIEQGRCTIVDDPFLMNTCDIDLVVDASGLPELGAAFAYDAIIKGKHVVMVNIEADCAVGPILRYHAERHGVIYTLADGDQPSLANGLYTWARTIGLEVSMIGKWSGAYSEEMSEKLLAQDKEKFRGSDFAHLDGTKNQMEMTSLANMTGFTPDIEGMHQPVVEFSDIPNVFRLKADNGILLKDNVVDVVRCRLDNGELIEHHFRGGVFAMVTSLDRYVLDQFNDKGLTMSKDGKYGVIYRQHHLIGVEAPMSVIKACLLEEATGTPKAYLSADVISIAKKDLKAGEVLDGQGGETVRGIAVPAQVSYELNALPISLAQDVYVKCDIPKGTKITYDMLLHRGESTIWKLRQEQDEKRIE